MVRPFGIGRRHPQRVRARRCARQQGHPRRRPRRRPHGPRPTSPTASPRHRCALLRRLRPAHTQDRRQQYRARLDRSPRHHRRRPRAVVAVLTRESDTTAAYTCFGATSAGQMWGSRRPRRQLFRRRHRRLLRRPEYVARPDAKVAHVVYSPAHGDAKTSEAWRTGNGQNDSLTVSREFQHRRLALRLGNRIDHLKNSARGEIGEILIFDRLLSTDERTTSRRCSAKWTTAEGLAAPRRRRRARPDRRGHAAACARRRGDRGARADRLV